MDKPNQRNPTGLLARKFQIYNKPYWSFVELATVLDVSETTARRVVKDINDKEPDTIRRFRRIGIYAADAIKVFQLEANKKRITAIATGAKI